MDGYGVHFFCVLVAAGSSQFFSFVSRLDLLHVNFGVPSYRLCFIPRLGSFFHILFCYNSPLCNGLFCRNLVPEIMIHG